LKGDTTDHRLKLTARNIGVWSVFHVMHKQGIGLMVMQTYLDIKTEGKWRLMRGIKGVKPEG